MGNAIIRNLMTLYFAIKFAWLLTFVLIYKGVEGTGKVVYFTTIYPYIVLFMIGVQGIN